MLRQINDSPHAAPKSYPKVPDYLAMVFVSRRDPDT